jgi:parallel beta-helix repeat protein
LDSAVNIIAYGDVIIKGTKDKPVFIKPIIEKVGWGKLKMKKEAKRLIIEHAVIEDGTILSFSTDIKYTYTTFNNSQNLPWDGAISRVYYSNIIIDNCSINGTNKGEGFLIHKVFNPVVTNSSFYKIPDAVEYISCSGGRIANCTFSDMYDDAIDLNDCTNTLIENNFISNASDRGMEIGSEHIGNSKGIKILRNVLVKCKNGIIFKEESFGTVENNTFYQNNVGVKIIELESEKGGKVTILNSIFYNNKINIQLDEISKVTIKHCLSNDVLLLGTNNIVADPMFVDPVSNNFNLMNTSPCIDAGYLNSPVDPDGSITDIGAFFFTKKQ